MQNALWVLIVCANGIFFCAACQTEAAPSTTLGEASVTLEDTNGWILTVQADGSGELRHRQVNASWPSRTFAFQRLRLLPAFTPRNQETYPYRWTYCKQEQEDTRQYSLPDTAWGAAWFEQAYRALEQSELSTRQIRRLRKSWQQQPPPGVAVR
jgi:hypothetical protein